MADTQEMMNLSAKLGENENKGELVLPQQSIVTQPSSAVFAEPVISAQPIMPAQRRRVPDFMQRMKVLAQMAGEDYRYSFPVKQKNGQKKTVEGGTIKMANDLVREYGNCMVDVRVVDQGDSHVFYARFIDYETGFCMTRPFRQRKSQKTMGDDPERAKDIVFQIGASKAIRNVVLNALGTFADFTYEEAKNALVDKVGQNIVGWRNKIIEGCKERGYDLNRIEQTVGKKIGEWVAIDISRVVAELKSVSDGMTTFDDLYPKIESIASLNKEFIGVDVAKEKDKTTVAMASVNKETGEAKVTPMTPTQAFDRLVDVLKAAPKKDRPALFLDNFGMDILEAVGRTKEIDKIISDLGIALP